MKEFINSSGKTLKVYADTKKVASVGTLNAGSTCKALDEQNGMVCVRYTVTASGSAKGAYKVGWVDYAKGVQ